MSTYLFVLTAGELERHDRREAEGVTIGVVATVGKAAKGQFALDERGETARAGSTTISASNIRCPSST